MIRAVTCQVTRLKLQLVCRDVGRIGCLNLLYILKFRQDDLDTLIISYGIKIFSSEGPSLSEAPSLRVVYLPTLSPCDTSTRIV